MCASIFVRGRSALDDRGERSDVFWRRRDVLAFVCARFAKSRRKSQDTESRRPDGRTRGALPLACAYGPRRVLSREAAQPRRNPRLIGLALDRRRALHDEAIDVRFPDDVRRRGQQQRLVLSHRAARRLRSVQWSHLRSKDTDEASRRLQSTAAAASERALTRQCGLKRHRHAPRR